MIICICLICKNDKYISINKLLYCSMFILMIILYCFEFRNNLYNNYIDNMNY